MKILYSCKKWDKEVSERKKNNALDLDLKNIKACIDHYIHSKEQTPSYLQINDAVSFYDLLGSSYFIYAGDAYMIKKDVNECLGYLYMYVLSNARSYDYEKSGHKITNGAIEYNHSQKRELEQIMFCAAAINRLDLFEVHSDGIGCELIKAMYYGDHKKAEKMVELLPETSSVYEKNKGIVSYCYEHYFMKALYESILSRDEIAFNKALIDRIRFIRKGYVMPVDIVSISMIKFAGKMGINYNFDVIEIPKFFLEQDLIIDFDRYKLPMISEKD